MHIVQIAPDIGPGSGVAGSAWRLGVEFQTLGHTVEDFTAESARVRNRRFRGGFAHGVARIWYAMEFTVSGTRAARRFLADRPDAVTICHNGVMLGDLYVNHGVVAAAMRERGDLARRMLRNPVHSFTYLRDRLRYRSDRHRAVVALTETEAGVLKRVYGKVRPPIAVIGHGVDLERFRPPEPAERTAARERLHLDDEHRVALFIGHEFERKGLALTITALVDAPTVLLLVVGGYAAAVAEATAQARHLGVLDRVLFAGPQTDLASFFAASDMFVFPSYYESFGLVITEALASGLPVIATATGVAPEVVVDGETGYLVGRDPREIADRMEQIAATDIREWRDACRAAVTPRTWRATAEKYLALLAEVAPERAGAR
ncbi:MULTISPECIES: glycosyltransferase family 4 protein [unclassified Microbacterium]|uniref:glycosyltransferase family 4 protein n=1 Tax=unclassified Microbacterium TaxID=2609290 RepID=UPI0012F824C1|nr:glycosyltransferase family 4 protein [Microbacterium sp. MAH-37]MVQ42626.1 glycosyltransferase [Microbacterium sp. MAH-37]